MTRLVGRSCVSGRTGRESGRRDGQHLRLVQEPGVGMTLLQTRAISNPGVPLPSLADKAEPQPSTNGTRGAPELATLGHSSRDVSLAPRCGNA
jgi:hypothetical protein